MGFDRHLPRLESHQKSDVHGRNRGAQPPQPAQLGRAQKRQTRPSIRGEVPELELESRRARQVQQQRLLQRQLLLPRRRLRKHAWPRCSHRPNSFAVRPKTQRSACGQLAILVVPRHRFLRRRPVAEER